MNRILIFVFMLFLFSFAYASVNATVFSYTEVPHASVNLTPDFPAPGNDLICEALVWNNDSFNMSVHFSWYKDGILQDNNSTAGNVTNNSVATATLHATETSEGENWTCKAYACFTEAGEVCGEEDNDSVVIGIWPTYLTQCQNITVPGEYILDADIVDYPGKVCFFINVSNVKLRLNGHVVDGSDVSSNAIAAFKALPDPYNSPGYWQNITVVDGEISDWNNATSPFGYPAGLLFGNASNITTENLSISNCGFPILFNPIFGIRINALSARDIEIAYSATPVFNFVDNAVVENFYVHDSRGNPYNTIDGGYGIQIQGSSNMAIANYSVRNVTWSSFYVIGNSNNITFENVSSDLAGWGAFTLLGSNNITIINATIEKTRALWVHPFSQHAVFFENGQEFNVENIILQNNSNQNGITVINSRDVLLSGVLIDDMNKTLATGLNITNVNNSAFAHINVFNIYSTVAGTGIGFFAQNTTNFSLADSWFANISCSIGGQYPYCGAGVWVRGGRSHTYKNIGIEACTFSYIEGGGGKIYSASLDNITFVDSAVAPVIRDLVDSNISNIYSYNSTRDPQWSGVLRMGFFNNVSVENITGENADDVGIICSVCENVTVKNIRINNFTQTSPYYNRACGFQFYYTTNSSLTNVFLTNITPSNYYAGGVGVFGSGSVMIENVTCYGCGRGFVVGVQLPSTNVTLRDSKFYNSQWYGISLWGYTNSYWNHGIHLFNVSVFNTSSGYSLYVRYANNTLIENCTFSERVDINGEIDEANNLTIRNNIFENGSLKLYDNVYDKTLIYNNIFNRSHVYDNAGNYWNTTYDCSQRSIINGDCIGGNWYNDYCGGDDGSGVPPIHNIAGDGIGDSYIPYTINGGTAQDELPLTLNNESTCGKITECTTLKISNMQYDVVNDLYGWKADYACITVKAENITLNCSGHAINGNISNWQARYGILYKYESSDPHPNNNMSFVNCSIKEYQYGIYLQGNPSSPTENAEVVGNSIDTTYGGIYEAYVRNSEIRNNIISNATGYGITLNGDRDVLTAENITVLSNRINTSSTGIYLSAVDFSTIRGNAVSGSQRGLYLYYSTGGMFDSNTLSDNGWNLYIERDSNPAYYRHNFTSNNLVGFGSELKPVYYYVENKTGDGISTNPPENAGFVAFVDSSGFEAKNLNMRNNSNAIIIANSTGINISNITSYYQALDGVYILSSQKISANGLYIYYGSKNGLYIFDSYYSSFVDVDLRNNRQTGGGSEGSSNIYFENIRVMNTINGFGVVGNTGVWPPKAENNTIKNLYIENVRNAFRIWLLVNLTGENITIKNATRVAVSSSNWWWPPEDYMNENVSLNEVRIYQGSPPWFVWIDVHQNNMNITNISFLANNTAGILFFPELNPNNSIADINNLRTDDWFVSLNASLLPEYNRSANIRIRTDGCNNVKVYSLTGFPLSREEIIQNGEVYPATINSCVANIVDFEVSGFTGYAANGTTKKPSGGGGGEEEEYIPPIIPIIEEKGLEECPPEEKTATFGAASIPYVVNKYYPKNKEDKTSYLVISNAGNAAFGSFAVSYSGKTFDYSSLAPNEFLLIKTTYTGDPCQPASITPAFAPPQEIIIDAPLEVPVGTNVSVNVSYTNGSHATNINIVLTNPLNKKVYYLTDENGQFSYIADREGAYIYSASGYVIRKSVITYAYLREAKSLIIPFYITEPTKISINIYSFGISIDSNIKIKDPYGAEKEARAMGGRYEEYILLPGKYVFTVTPLEKVQSISAQIELEKAQFVLPLFDKPEFLFMLIFIILLILAVDYYRTKLMPKQRFYSAVLLTKPYAGKPVKVRIVDEKGNPVAKANIRIYLEYEGMLVDEKKTDRNGILSFTPKEKGMYLLECEGIELKKNEINIQ
ncbi:MAG: right-handed parallel beta-helix repeat-containing protein [Candidatus Micrarchaeia archaeon]